MITQIAAKKNNDYYVVDPVSKQIIAKVDKRLWHYYYLGKFEKDIQPNLYFDNESSPV